MSLFCAVPADIGNLHPRVTVVDLEPKLIKYGTITNLWVAKNPPGKQSCGIRHGNKLYFLAGAVMQTAWHGIQHGIVKRPAKSGYRQNPNTRI